MLISCPVESRDCNGWGKPLFDHRVAKRPECSDRGTGSPSWVSNPVVEIFLRRCPVRKASFAPLILAVALCSPSTSSGRGKPLKVTTPLSADEMAIYRAVLQQNSSDEGGTLHVSRTTYPLNPESPTSALTTSGCLKGIQLEDLATIFHSSPGFTNGKGNDAR
jgi:hypothetical protein